MIIQGAPISSLGIIADRTVPQVNDDDVLLPNVIQPYLCIPFPLQQIDQPAAGSTTVAEMRTSFINGFTVSRAAAAGLQATRLAVLLQGLWHLRLEAHFTLPASVSLAMLFFQFGDEDVALTSIPLLNMTTGAGGIGFKTVQWDGWFSIRKRNRLRLEVWLTNTAGATPMEFSGGWVANRYL